MSVQNSHLLKDVAKICPHKFFLGMFNEFFIKLAIITSNEHSKCSFIFGQFPENSPLDEGPV